MDSSDRVFRRKTTVVLLVVLGIGIYFAVGAATYYWKEHVHHYESGAVSRLFALHTVQENYRKDHGAYADSFARLGVPLGAELIGDSLIWNGPYRYRLVDLVRNGNGTVLEYQIEARPMSFSDRTRRSFVMDQTGYIHFTDENREPTVKDPAIPPEK